MLRRVGFGKLECGSVAVLLWSRRSFTLDGAFEVLFSLLFGRVRCARRAYG